MTPKQTRFVAEYLVDLNGTQAAIRAGYSKRTARVMAQELLANPVVSGAVTQARSRQIARVEHTADDVLRELWHFVRADTNELIEHRRICCRYCWGIGHRRQCTPAERELRYSQYLRDASLAMEDTDDGATRVLPPFDELGGLGYDKKRDPHPGCPECHGEGVGVPFPKDTRKLSPAARSLYAGVKVTAEGLQVMQHSKDKAIELLGRHHGLWNEPKAPEPEGPGMVIMVQTGVSVEGNRVTSATRISVEQSARVAVELPEPE